MKWRFAAWVLFPVHACCLAVALSPDDMVFIAPLVDLLLTLYPSERAVADATERLAEYPHVMAAVVGGIYAGSGRPQGA